jgi:hypothetical protein
MLAFVAVAMLKIPQDNLLHSHLLNLTASNRCSPLVNLQHSHPPNLVVSQAVILPALQVNLEPSLLVNPPDSLQAGLPNHLAILPLLLASHQDN